MRTIGNRVNEGRLRRWPVFCCQTYTWRDHIILLGQSSVAVNIDTSIALRGVHDLQRLVEAVITADEHDELDWVEWKGPLDLATKAGCFHVARAVLGMANRLPDRAGLTCRGLGYVIVGVEPSNLLGITSVDPATMDQYLDAYLGGAAGPRYTPTYVPVMSKTTLVVAVEAPKPGDPIFSLRREFDNTRNGTVFVRKPGRTVPADARDLDALQTRLLSRPAPIAELEVGLAGDAPVSWIDARAAPDEIERWVTDQKARVVADAREVERRRRQPPVPRGVGIARQTGLQGLFQEMARQQEAIDNAMGNSWALGERDKRTIEEYLTQVDKWAENYLSAALSSLRGRYVETGHGVVALTVQNPTGRFLTDVEIEAHFDGDNIIVLDEKPRLDDLPSPPRPYGQRRPSALLSPGLDWNLHRPALYGIERIHRRIWAKDGSARLKFHVGDLRQHATDTSDSIYLILLERPSDGIIRGTWKATIRDQEGLLSGTFDIRVADDPVDILELFRDEADTTH
jgi:hypothetical protein